MQCIHEIHSLSLSLHPSPCSMYENIAEKKSYRISIPHGLISGCLGKEKPNVGDAM